MAVVGYATIQLIPSLRGFAGSTNSQMGPIVRSTGTQAGQQAGGLFGGSFLGAVGKIMAAAGIYELGSKVASTFTGAFATGIKGFADLQTYTISFETLLGSAKAADNMIRDLYKFAAVTPFDVSGSVIGAQKLLGVNVAAKDIIPTLTTLGDATAALGGSTNEFNAVLLAYSQIMARGKVSTQDLYQISNTGIPIFQLMSKALGKPVGEIQKLIETGNLASDDVLPKLLDQMNKEYGGAMAKQATTLTGLWSTFKDTMGQVLTQALTPLGEWLVQQLPGFTTVASGAIQYLSDKFTQFANWVGQHKTEIGQVLDPLISAVKNTDWDGLLGGIGTAMTAMWTIAQPILAEFAKYIGDNLPLGVSALTDLLNVLFKPMNEDASDASGQMGAFTGQLDQGSESATNAQAQFRAFLYEMGLIGPGAVNTTFGLGKMAAAILDGKSWAEITAGVLNGTYGPSLQKQADLAGKVGDATRLGFSIAGNVINTFVATAVTKIAGFVASVSGQFTSIIATVIQKITQFASVTVAGISTAANSMRNTLVAGAQAMVQGFFTWIAQIPVKIASMVASALASLNSGTGRFRSSGEALIGGFISGIESMIERAKAAAKRVVDAVSQFFPHSPAPEGPFSGRGWTLYSGRSLVGGFEDGIKQRQSSLRRTMADTFKTPGIGDMPAPASLRGALNTATQAQSNGNYIGTVNLPTTDGGTGVIDELTFLLRTLNRGGR